MVKPAGKVSHITFGGNKNPDAMTAGELAGAIRKPTALPDQVAGLLRDMIVSGKWRPGQRIVETRIARELGLGQPTVREALGKLEEAGLVVRTQNSGCRVTQLTAQEYSEIYRVRTALECLAVELLVEKRKSAHGKELKAALQALKAAAASGSVEEFYQADLKLHQTIWALAGNKFLEKTLSQLVIPLFAFTMIEIIGHPEFDLVGNARRHEKLVRTILTADKAHARRRAEQALEEFRNEGLSLVARGQAAVEERRPRRSAGKSRS